MGRGGSRISIYLIAALVGFLAAVGLYMAFGGDSGPTAQRVVTRSGKALIGGPFKLTDQTGKKRSDSEFRGRLMLVFFGYTHCPDVCPTDLQTMSDALDLLGAAGKKVQPIFITVDPARDTVAQLKDYAGNFHPRLLALTGTPREIAAVAKEYRVYYARVRQSRGSDGLDYFMDHSSLTYLMGPDGSYITHFRHGISPKNMAKAIKKHL